MGNKERGKIRMHDVVVSVYAPTDCSSNKVNESYKYPFALLQKDNRPEVSLATDFSTQLGF